MARNCPQRLCGQMCQEWRPLCSAESSQTTVGTGRFSRGYHQWLERYAFLGHPEIQYRRCWWLPWFWLQLPWTNMSVSMGHTWLSSCALPLLLLHPTSEMSQEGRTLASYLSLWHPVCYIFHPSMVWVWPRLVVYRVVSGICDTTVPLDLPIISKMLLEVIL